MTDGLLSYSLEGSIALIQLDDGKANALSEPMIEALSSSITRAEKEASAIVLAGRPDRFCAGFDLKTMMSSMEAAVALLRRGAALLMQLYGTPLPLVIACSGHAKAGGALVVLTGDHRIGASGPYQIGLNEVQIGLPVPVLAMELARDRLSPAELLPATLQAKIYDPESAVKAGYLDEVVAAGELLAKAKAEAARLGTLGRVPYSATKQRLRGRTIAHINGTLDDDMRAIVGGAPA